MNALKLMEYAVDKEGNDYQFSATYYKDLGIFIDKLNGTGSAGKCYWSVNIGYPGGEEELSQVGVSTLDIPNGYTLIMKYGQ